MDDPILSLSIHGEYWSPYFSSKAVTLSNIFLCQVTSLGEVFGVLVEVGILAEPEVLVLCGDVALGVAVLQWKVWPIVGVGGGAH